MGKLSDATRKVDEIIKREITDPRAAGKAGKN
jgi:hypothetical protein